MLNKLFKLHGRLFRAAAEAWLAKTDYRLEHAGTADFDATFYDELSQRADILIDACTQLTVAAQVIHAIGDTSNSDKIRYLIETHLKDANDQYAKVIRNPEVYVCGQFLSGRIDALREVLKILEDA